MLAHPALVDGEPDVSFVDHDHVGLRQRAARQGLRGGDLHGRELTPPGMVRLLDAHVERADAVFLKTLEGLVDQGQGGHAERDALVLGHGPGDDVGGNHRFAAAGRSLQHGPAMACHERSFEPVEGGDLMGAERTQAHCGTSSSQVGLP